MLTAEAIRALLTCDGKGRFEKAHILTQLLQAVAATPKAIDHLLAEIERAKSS